MDVKSSPIDNILDSIALIGETIGLNWIDVFWIELEFCESLYLNFTEYSSPIY